VFTKKGENLQNRPLYRAKIILRRRVWVPAAGVRGPPALQCLSLNVSGSHLTLLHENCQATSPCILQYRLNAIE